SWCDAILCYGSFLQPAGARPATHIPWHNSAYRREILLSFGDRLDFLLQADSALQSALARQGYRFSMAAQASTEHWNSSVLRHQLIALFWGNRLYAANRATLDNWGFPRRLLYAISWPAIAALRLWRACRICFSLGDRRLRYSTLLPVLAAGACVAAAGEACGHLFGLGPHTLRRRCHYELNRTLHVTPSEVAMLAE
ncbi:MAG: hypothetical protein LAO79_19750, partial [Acidobacteriia bacterium]|nr:hypothetical protein [Terriglobia bacterium]